MIPVHPSRVIQPAKPSGQTNPFVLFPIWPDPLLPTTTQGCRLLSSIYRVYTQILQNLLDTPVGSLRHAEY